MEWGQCVGGEGEGRAGGVTLTLSTTPHQLTCSHASLSKLQLLPVA